MVKNFPFIIQNFSSEYTHSVMVMKNVGFGVIRWVKIMALTLGQDISLLRPQFPDL